MKRRILLIAISMLVVFTGLIYVGFLAPYNLVGTINPKGLGVINQNSFSQIDELSQYFKGHKIIKVKYLGSDTYKVTTDKGEYVIIADYSDSTFWKYKVFKLDKKAQYFTNPM